METLCKSVQTKTIREFKFRKVWRPQGLQITEYERKREMILDCMKVGLPKLLNSLKDLIKTYESQCITRGELIQFRKERALSLGDLSRIIGVPKNKLADWLNHKRSPDDVLPIPRSIFLE